jgi:phosphoribosylaminoimidazole-succinocarboxamide synthase
MMAAEVGIPRDDRAGAAADGVWQTEIPGVPPPKRGKVRDVYDLGDRLLIVACDRISAYDHVLRPAIPGKGKILNQLSNFWFSRLEGHVRNHLISTDLADLPPAFEAHRTELAGRAVLVEKAAVVPFECVARGYLAGSAFKEYRQGGTACGIPLPPGLDRASLLPEPIFTPATKAETGHDVNVTFDEMAAAVGLELASRLRDLTLALYGAAAEHARERGLLLADTKLEFGIVDGQAILIDEVFTPDSSRYWEASAWRPGEEPVSFDKQFVRNWLDSSGWDHESAPPELPAEVVTGTRDRYVEAFRRITGGEPEL